MWILLGWAEALWVYILCYYQVEAPFGDASYNLMAAGQNVFITCVIVANLKLLQMTHNWTYWGEALMFLQIFSFYPIMAVFAEITYFELIYKIMVEFLTSIYAWLGLFLAVTSLILLKTLHY